MVRNSAAARSEVSSPFGAILLDTRPDEAPAGDLIAVAATGRLIGPGGALAGLCRFSSYRRPPGTPPLGAAQICRALDAVSQEEEDLGEALARWDPQRLEGYVNDSCLLVAERVEVFAPLKGGGAWKALYFATMEKALSAHPGRPDEFFFTVFPLDFSGRVSRANMAEFRVALRDMQRFYAIHLGARALGLAGSSGSFMHAPLPANLGRGKGESA